MFSEKLVGARGFGPSTLYRNIHSRPRRKRGRLPAGDSVCERNSIRRIRAQIRVRFEVSERVGHFARETVFRDLMDGELVPLSIQGADDFIEAHEISDQWQVLAVASLIRERERSGDDVAEFANVTHVNATDARIERQRPAHRTIYLLLRSKGVCEVLVEERRNDERMIRKPCFCHDAIDLRLASEVGNVESAAADRFDIRQRGPDKVFHAGSFRGEYRCRPLRELVGALFPKVGDQEIPCAPVNAG